MFRLFFSEIVAACLHCPAIVDNDFVVHEVVVAVQIDCGVRFLDFSGQERVFVPALGLGVKDGFYFPPRLAASLRALAMPGSEK